jgi:hypothetical protein
MPEFLVGVMFHEPEPFAQWNRGLIEDYESSTGLFVDADSAADALVWGEQVGQVLLRYVNRDGTLDWSALGYHCWLEEAPEKSGWGHCLSFFQRVRVGELPNLEQMTSAAYARWLEQCHAEHGAVGDRPGD